LKSVLSFNIPASKATKPEDASALTKTSHAKVQKKANHKLMKAANSGDAGSTTVEYAKPVAADGPVLSREELRARFQAKLEVLRQKRGADTVKNQVKQAKKNAEKKKEGGKDKKQQQKQVEKKETPVQQKPAVVVEAGRQIFSKFDFGTESPLASQIPGVGKPVKPKVKAFLPKNPKQALEKLQRKAEQLGELEKTDASRAEAIKKSDAWTKAIQKSQGITVKDDVKLLKKSIHKMEKVKAKKADSWTDRKRKVEEEQAARQTKRNENIQARKDARKAKRAGIKVPQKKRPGFEGGHFRKPSKK
jgi:hypothetical protein